MARAILYTFSVFMTLGIYFVSLVDSNKSVEHSSAVSNKEESRQYAALDADKKKVKKKSTTAQVD